MEKWPLVLEHVILELIYMLPEQSSIKTIYTNISMEYPTAEPIPKVTLFGTLSPMLVDVLDGSVYVQVVPELGCHSAK